MIVTETGIKEGFMMADGEANDRSMGQAVAADPVHYGWAFDDRVQDSVSGLVEDRFNFQGTDDFVLRYQLDPASSDLIGVTLQSRSAGDGYWPIEPEQLLDVLQDPEKYASEVDVVTASPYMGIPEADMFVDPARYGWTWGGSHLDGETGEWGELFVPPSKLHSDEEYRLVCHALPALGVMTETAVFTVDSDGEYQLRGRVSPGELHEVLQNPGGFVSKSAATAGTVAVDALESLRQRIDAIHDGRGVALGDDRSGLRDGGTAELYEAEEVNEVLGFHSGLDS